MMQSILATINVVARIVAIFAAGLFIVAWIVALVGWDGEKNCDMNCDTCPFPPCDTHTKEATHGKP